NSPILCRAGTKRIDTIAYYDIVWGVIDVQASALGQRREGNGDVLETPEFQVAAATSHSGARGIPCSAAAADCRIYWRVVVSCASWIGRSADDRLGELAREPSE